MKNRFKVKDDYIIQNSYCFALSEKLIFPKLA